MSVTALDRKVYEAEGRTTSALGLVPLTERRTLSYLYRFLPPHLTRALSVTPVARLGGRKWRKQASVEVFLDGTILLEILVPADVLVVTHEIAHILLDTSREGFASTLNPDHGAAFRETHLWVVRQVLGLRTARVLSDFYDQEGLPPCTP